MITDSDLQTAITVLVEVHESAEMRESVSECSGHGRREIEDELSISVEYLMALRDGRC